MKTKEEGNEFMSAADGRLGIVGRAADVSALRAFARIERLERGIDGS